MKLLFFWINLLIASIVWLISFGGLVVNGDDIYRGLVTLDDFTFDKIVSKFRYSLIKFDNPYPYGQNHENVVHLSRELSRELSYPQLVVANLEIKDYGEKDSWKISKRFGINREQYPALVLLINKKPELESQVLDYRNLTTILYPEQRNLTTDKIILDPASMKLFLWKHTKGKIRPTLPNCTRELDELAGKFIQLLGAATPEENRDEEIEKIFEKIDSMIKQSNLQPEVKNYHRLMEKGKQRGKLFYESECDRLDSLLQSQSITSTKREELRAYWNVLQSFLAPPFEVAEDKETLEKSNKQTKINKVEL